MSKEEELEQKYASLFPHLNERQQHLVAAVDAEQLGRGGIALASRVTGFLRWTPKTGPLGMLNWSEVTDSS
jgi:hypothetical protein